MAGKNVNPLGAQVAACGTDESCEVLSCEVCLVEIPSSVAQSVEGPDYVHHFCGLDCLEVWRKTAAAGAAGKKQ
jgi:hypothetical protein